MQNNNQSPSPCGVPLEDLQAAINSTNLTAIREGDALVVQHDRFITRVEVSAPEIAETMDANISAIVRIKSILPAELSQIFGSKTFATTMNSMATLGALMVDNGRHVVASRLTVYEGHDNWSLDLGLIFLSVISSAETIMGATRKVLAKEQPRQTGPSAWTESDFEFVASYLSRVCVCTTGGLGLTAEFGIRSGQTSAAAGHHYTALWQMMADQPHPEMGSGLFCLLNMPHEISNKDRLDYVLAELNRLEMQGNDLPPHFGAWCRGSRDTNPAYVTFLPNSLHRTNGIALNVSTWAMNRAQLADAMLATMGIR